VGDGVSRRKIELPGKEEQESDVAMFTAWCRRRYQNAGEEGNMMTFETVEYNNLLLGDLGLSSHRKGWFKDFWAPQWARDYKGLKAEFAEVFRYREVAQVLKE
jgi:dimethylaniline monooxygenase (N-oxide forming)